MGARAGRGGKRGGVTAKQRGKLKRKERGKTKKPRQLQPRHSQAELIRIANPAPNQTKQNHPKPNPKSKISPNPTKPNLTQPKSNPTQPNPDRTELNRTKTNQKSQNKVLYRISEPNQISKPNIYLLVYIFPYIYPLNQPTSHTPGLGSHCHTAASLRRIASCQNSKARRLRTTSTSSRNTRQDWNACIHGARNRLMT